MKTLLRSLKWITLTTVVAALVLVLACSSKSSTTTTNPVSSTTTTSTSTTTTTAVPGNTVMTANKAGVGDYLVDGSGMTLYYFAKDVIGKSNATAAIIANWPVFNPASFVVSANLQASDFATITRADGQKQATYKGWPLYHYGKDAAAGDTLGDGVGGIWFLVKVPFYTVLLQNNAAVNTYLGDDKGMTLYYFTKDSVGVSNASAAILANWPIFNPASFIVPSALQASDFGTITRTDGQKQATFRGYPLYYYAKDMTSGDTMGQGVGSVWFVVNPANFPPAPVSTSSTTTATTTTTTTSTTAPAPTSTTTTSTTPGASVTLSLVAKNIGFDKSTLTVPANSKVTINFDNQDSGILHNVSIYQNGSYGQTTAIFVGQTITGPATTTYTFTAPSAGTYFFQCDVHPQQMTGSFIVTP